MTSLTKKFTRDSLRMSKDFITRTLRSFVKMEFCLKKNTKMMVLGYFWIHSYSFCMCKRGSIIWLFKNSHNRRQSHLSYKKFLNYWRHFQFQSNLTRCLESNISQVIWKVHEIDFTKIIKCNLIKSIQRMVLLINFQIIWYTTFLDY